MGKLELKLPNFFGRKSCGGASAGRERGSAVVSAEVVRAGARGKGQCSRDKVTGVPEVTLAQVEEELASDENVPLIKRVGRRGEGDGDHRSDVATPVVEPMSYEESKRAEKQPIEVGVDAGSMPKRPHREEGLSKQGFVFRYKGEEPFVRNLEACGELHRLVSLQGDDLPLVKDLEEAYEFRLVVRLALRLAARTTLLTMSYDKSLKEARAIKKKARSEVRWLKKELDEVKTDLQAAMGRVSEAERKEKEVGEERDRVLAEKYAMDEELLGVTKENNSMKDELSVLWKSRREYSQEVADQVRPELLVEYASRFDKVRKYLDDQEKHKESILESTRLSVRLGSWNY